MSSAPVVHRSAVEDQESAPVLPVAAGGGGQASPPPSVHFAVATAPEPAGLARDTVAAVLHAVNAQERPAPATSRVVNLRFDFGPDTLAVRVEFRDGAVQAHFRTESPELRTALAQEWRQAAAAPENALRLAEPIFTAAPGRGEQPSSFNADGGASRQQSQAQPPAAGFFTRPALSGLAASSVAAAPEAPRPSTVLHLHAFA